jgi:bifunctional UDP-N-acetylglucosamine pyrophosphorylase / glucosamine-1-phosphate N-acetyltransferase
MTAAKRRAPKRPSSEPSRRTLAVVVLAAGKGKRLKSTRPKVLHELCGRPSLWFVLQAARAARPDRVVLVVSERDGPVERAVRAWDLVPDPVFVEQPERLGTGNAVTVAEQATARFDDVLVMAGDDPLIRPGEVRRLMAAHRRSKAAGSILTTHLDDPSGYGRIVRDRSGDLAEIGEEPDVSAEVRAIHEVALLVYAFRRADLFRALPLVGTENPQHEYYLHHVFPILRDKGERIKLVSTDVGGVFPQLNSRGGLAKVAKVMRERILEAHMANGVTFVDPAAAYVDVGVRIGEDTIVHPLALLEGETRIGRECRIGPSVRIVDAAIADGAEVTFSVVRGARVGRGATVGPFASLRQGTVLEEGAKAGTFVEVKNSRVGPGSKVPHLSYVGDATIGRHVNLGAGTITCNFDGYEKHNTTIGDESFIGSDTMLVAPVKLGKRVWTGAGSVIAKDVPAGSLAVERSDQRVVKGYDERKRRSHDGRAPGGKRHEPSGGGSRG